GTGLLAWLAVLVTTGRLLGRALRRAGPAAAGAAAGVVAYATQALFLFPVAELDPIAWLLAGVAVAGVVRPAEEVTWAVPAPVVAAAGGLAAASLAVGALDVTADRAALRVLDAPPALVADP